MLVKLGRGAAMAPRQSRHVRTTVVVCIAIGTVLAIDALFSSGPLRGLRTTAEFPAFSARHSASATPRLRGSTEEPPMRAIIVASPRDCPGNLRFANVLMQRNVAAVVGIPELVVSGPSRDTVSLRQVLPPLLAVASIRMLQANERQLLHAIGHHATPVLLLFDGEGRLRLSTHVESDAVARTSVARAIAHVTTRDPTH